MPDCELGSKATCNRDLRNHLRRKPNLTEDETMEHVPFSKAELARQSGKSSKESKKSKPTWTCPVAGCTSKGAFPANRDRRDHLEKFHKWSNSKVIGYVPFSTAEVANQEDGSDKGRKEKEVSQAEKA
ncbi:hypothetical protein MMC18_001883 [Xylographa bjoerkii]|nr:hypothetical protein [Xylographa bjoerkii]